MGGLCHVQRISTLWANAPHGRTLSRTPDFDTRQWEWPPQDIVYSSLGVTSSKIMPLVGGLCLVQRTSTSKVNMICPCRRTLSRTMDFNQQGQHDLPLIGGLCLVQRTSPAGQHYLPLIGGLCHVQRTSPTGQHDLQQDRA
jgi:hypothetical protein